MYSRPTVACVPSTATRLLFDWAQAGLIAGTVPTKGTVKRDRNSREGKRGCRVAGYDNEVGLVPGDCLGEDFGDTGHEPVLSEITVGKASVIREVNIACV